MAATSSKTRPPKPHLTSSQRRVTHGGGRYGAKKPREWYCLECTLRVTVSPDGLREYGHKRACSHHATLEVQG